MPPWLPIWIARWLSGERFRKATSEDYRLQFSAFFFGGVWMDFAVLFGRRFLDHTSTTSIWLCGTVVISALTFGAIAWARLVPATISFVLGLIAWGTFAWMMLR